MMRHVTRRNIAVAVGSLLSVVLAAGTAKAITSNNFVYSTAKTGYLHIPTSAFVPVTSATSYTNDGEVLRLGADANPYACFLAPVNLPNGVELTKVHIWYEAPNGTAILFEVRRSSITDGLAGDMTVGGQGQQPPNSATRRSAAYNFAPSVAKVNNAQFSYQALVCMTHTTVGLYNMRLTYTYTSAGD